MKNSKHCKQKHKKRLQREREREVFRSGKLSDASILKTYAPFIGEMGFCLYFLGVQVDGLDVADIERKIVMFYFFCMSGNLLLEK